MGTQERKLRDKEQLKELILKAARETFLERGYESTSIRSIADRAEYSPGTIYLHYKDKDSILFELKNEGFVLLFQQMMVLQSVEDPFERLKAMGRIYLNFAMEHSDYYDLMFVIKAPLNILEDEECWLEGQKAFEVLVSVVRECILHGRFKEQDPEALAFVIWSALHGMVTLSLKGRCRVIREEIREDIEKIGLDVFLKLLSKN